MTSSELVLCTNTIEDPFRLLLVSAKASDHACLPTFLKQVKCVVHQAFSCAEARDALQQFRIPIIVSEQTLTDGEWTRLQDPGGIFPPPEVIVIAARNDPKFWAEAVLLGALDVLSRPVTEPYARRAVLVAYSRWSRSAERVHARAENCESSRAQHGLKLALPAVAARSNGRVLPAVMTPFAGEPARAPSPMKQPAIAAQGNLINGDSKLGNWQLKTRPLPGFRGRRALVLCP